MIQPLARTPIFEPLFPDVPRPKRATEESAGYDLRAHLGGRKLKFFNAKNEWFTRPVRMDRPTIELYPGETAVVPTGFKLQLSAGTFALAAARSGKALKVRLVLANQVGIIDADYPDEWLVLATNASDLPLVIDHGEAIAQFVVLPFVNIDDMELGSVGQSTDRVGGLGSTGA